MAKKYYEAAKMDNIGRLQEHEIIQAENWLQAKNAYQKKHGGEDYEIMVRVIPL